MRYKCPKCNGQMSSTTKDYEPSKKCSQCDLVVKRDEFIKTDIGWISVKDKLPNINTKVAYKMENGEVDFGGYNGIDFWTFDPISISEVTHWMYFDECKLI